VPLEAGLVRSWFVDACGIAMEKDESGTWQAVVFCSKGRPRLMRLGAAGSCVCGTTHLIVVEDDDAVLVADRSRVQDIKGLVSPSSWKSRRRPTRIEGSPSWVSTIHRSRRAVQVNASW